MIRRFFFVFSLLVVQAACAQVDSTLYSLTELSCSTKMPKRWQRNLLAQLKTCQSLVCIQEKILNVDCPPGFPECSLTLDTIKGKKAYLNVHIGKYYQLTELNIEGVPLRQVKEISRLPAPYTPNLITQKLERLLHSYENNGYPFAQLIHENTHYYRIDINKIGLKLEYNFNTGNLVVWDSLIIPTNLRENKRFLSRLTGIKKGQRFRQNTLAQVPLLLNNSPYYQNARPPLVYFEGKHATVQLRCERKKANRFDGLLGILPPQSNTQTLRFSGMLDLLLVSTVRAGEIFSLRFDWFPPATQKLNVGLSLPYLFGTPIKAEASFQLLKQDTLFLTRKLEPSIGYDFGNGISGRLFWRSYVSTLLNASVYKNRSWPPPPVLDANSSLYGLGLVVQKVDYLPNPKRGIIAQADFAFGTRNIKKNTGLDSLDYNRLNFSQNRVEWSVKCQLFYPLYRRHILSVALQALNIILPQYFDNDLAFLGGARSLRGFNENQFLVSSAYIGTVEYRYRLDTDAYLGAFVDFATLTYRSLILTQHLQPIGVGFSFLVKTPAGLVSLSYAVGQSETQVFQPIRGRVHLGLINQF